MQSKLLAIEVVPHPKKPERFRLTITWATDTGMMVVDESSHLFLQGVEEEIKRFHIKHPHL